MKKWYYYKLISKLQNLNQHELLTGQRFFRTAYVGSNLGRSNGWMFLKIRKFSKSIFIIKRCRAVNYDAFNWPSKLEVNWWKEIVSLWLENYLFFWEGGSCYCFGGSMFNYLFIFFFKILFVKKKLMLWFSDLHYIVFSVLLASSV